MTNVIFWHCFRKSVNFGENHITQRGSVFQMTSEWCYSEWWFCIPVFFWSIPWTEEPGELQSMGSQRVGHNWATFTFPLWALGKCDSVKSSLFPALGHGGSRRRLVWGSLTHKPPSVQRQSICHQIIWHLEIFCMSVYLVQFVKHNQIFSEGHIKQWEASLLTGRLISSVFIWKFSYNSLALSSRPEILFCLVRISRQQLASCTGFLIWEGTAMISVSSSDSCLPRKRSHFLEGFCCCC